MPLMSGRSRGVVSKNISELVGSYKRKGKIGFSRPKNAAAARRQATAIALKKAGRSKFY
jgi:hypothetical protein